MNHVQRVPYTGPQSIAGARMLREDLAERTEWPYPWIYPPPGAIRVTAGADATGSLVTPALAFPTVGLTYTVEQGVRFGLTDLVVMYINDGVAGTPNPGDFTWTLDVNNAPGITLFGYPVQGLKNVDVPLGTLQIPWPLKRPEIFKAGDVLRLTLTNVALAVGDPNYFKVILLGWKWSA